MERFPEPELMEATSHAAAYAAADFSSSDASFVNRLASLTREYELSPTPCNLLVDLGCGPGKVTEQLARRWPNWTVLGIDGSTAMLNLAVERRDSSRDSSLHNLHYCKLDLTKLGNRASNFYRQAGIIVSNSLLHHLHVPSVLWRVVEHLAVPGALTLHRDLRRPSSSEAAVDLVRRYAESASATVRHDYLASLHAAFTTAEVQSQLLHHPLLSVSVVPVADRYLEVSGYVEPGRLPG